MFDPDCDGTAFAGRSLCGRQGCAGLKEGLQARQHGRPALRNGLQDATAGCKAVVDDRHLYHVPPDLFHIEGHLRARLGPPGLTAQGPQTLTRHARSGDF